MHEFETFAYLDVQKTGSTFISFLLQKFCTEKELDFRKHGQVGDRYDPKKFYFISARDPLDQYMSLYSHGCGGKGNLYHKLRRKGVDDLYNSSLKGFRRWLRFVLDPVNAKLLDNDYGSSEQVCGLIGFQTYRYLELAILDPTETLAACKTQDDLRKAYKAKNIVNDTVRNERLNADLGRLITTRLRASIPDAEGALKFLEEGHRLNASDRIDRFEEGNLVNKKGTKRLQEREWFLHELFGY
jgi:sulfotransferase famil protein